MKQWIPDDKVLAYIEHGDPIRGNTPVEWWCTVSLWTKDKLPGGVAGITFHKDRVVFSDRVLSWDHKRQAQLLYHELVHVAQQAAMPQGWIGFMFTYGWQWMRAGFNYNRMKKFGIEKEAYAAEYRFRDKIANVWFR